MEEFLRWMAENNGELRMERGHIKSCCTMRLTIEREDGKLRYVSRSLGGLDFAKFDILSTNLELMRKDVSADLPEATA